MRRQLPIRVWMQQSWALNVAQTGCLASDNKNPARRIGDNAAFA